MKFTLHPCRVCTDPFCTFDARFVFFLTEPPFHTMFQCSPFVSLAVQSSYEKNQIENACVRQHFTISPSRKTHGENFQVALFRKKETAEKNNTAMNGREGNLFPRFRLISAACPQSFRFLIVSETPGPALYNSWLYYHNYIRNNNARSPRRNLKVKAEKVPKNEERSRGRIFASDIFRIETFQQTFFIPNRRRTLTSGSLSLSLCFFVVFVKNLLR